MPEDIITGNINYTVLKLLLTVVITSMRNDTAEETEGNMDTADH